MLIMSFPFFLLLETFLTGLRTTHRIDPSLKFALYNLKSYWLRRAHTESEWGAEAKIANVI